MLYKGYNQKSIPLPPIVVLALVETWTWFLQLPGIFAAADRFPLKRRVLLRSLLAQGTLFALAHIAIRILVTSYLPWSSEPALLVLAAQYRKLEQRELRASQPEVRLLRGNCRF